MKRSALGIALLAFGLATVATGAYFMLLRPPLLPEDLRFTGAAPVSSEMKVWLSIVFATWGGFITAFGLAVTGAALFRLRGDPRWLWGGIAIGLIVACIRFFVSNVLLQSDFLWFVASLSVVGVGAAIVLAWQELT